MFAQIVLSEVQYTYSESTRIGVRNPSYDNKNYSLFALTIEGPINFVEAGKMDGFIFEATGELCLDKDKLSRVRLKMPCNGVLLVIDEEASEILSGSFVNGAKIELSNNFCKDFFKESTDNMLNELDGRSYTISLKCDDNSPAKLDETDEGYVFNVEKVFQFIFVDGKVSYDLSIRDDNQAPYIAKTPLNLPIVFGNIFNNFGIECKTGKNCKTEVANFILDLVTNPVAIEKINNKNVAAKVSPIKESKNTDLCLPKDGCEKLKVTNGKLPKGKDLEIVDGQVVTFNRGEDFDTSRVDCHYVSSEAEENTGQSNNSNAKSNAKVNINVNSVDIECEPGEKLLQGVDSSEVDVFACCKANDELFYYNDYQTCHCVKKVL